MPRKRNNGEGCITYDEARNSRVNNKLCKCQ